MGTSPYRTPAPRPDGREPCPDTASADDTDLLPVFAIVWIASLVRVAQAFLRPEGLGSELALACIAAVALPLAARQGIKDLLKNRRARAARSSG
jgi:hypothetical protein